MTLCFLLFFVLIKIGVSQLPTPCPGIFSYEPREIGSDRWYGEILYSAPDNLTGVWLHITLDRPADILGNWFGQVTTNDNTVFVIQKAGYTLQTGQQFKIRFFVKYNLAKPIPSVRMIKFNKIVICTDQLNKPNTNKPISSNHTVINQSAKPSEIPHSNSGFSTDNSSSNESMKASVCGIAAVKATPLILGGQETSPGQWPWHAALYHHQDYEIKYVCGATLITKQHVVTAAHCVTDPGTKTVLVRSGVSVSLGKYNLQTFEEDFQHMGIANISVYPKYNPWRSFNDIAVLKLSHPARITDFVRPCCLWEGDSNLANIIDKEGIVVGWGFNGKTSHKLLLAKMPVVSTSDCIFSKKEYREFLSENNYCAGSRDGTSACKGDSGGAMVFPKKNSDGQTVWYIRGIVSLSLVPENGEICETSYYNIFTDVAKFTQWIKDVIRG